MTESYYTSIIHSYFGSPSWNVMVIYMLLTSFCLYLFKNGANLVFEFYWRRFWAIISERLQLKIYATYLTKDYQFHSNRGEVQFKQYIDSIRSPVIIVSNCIIIISDIFMITAILAMLLRINFYATSILSITMVLMLLIMNKIISIISTKMGRIKQSKNYLITKIISNSISNLKEIKLYNLQGHFKKKLSTHSKSYYKALGYDDFLAVIPRTIIESITVSAFGIVILWIISQSNHTTIIPLMGSYAIAAFRILPVASRFSNMIREISFHKAMVNNIKDVIKLDELKAIDTNETPSKKDKISFDKSLVIKNLAFKFNGQTKNILNIKHLEVKKGQKIGLVGLSGGGKSTLVDIMMGILSPTKGEILVDGQSIDKNLAMWQSNIGYVPQSINLSDDTIKENIALGVDLDQIDGKLLHQALADSQLLDFINNLPAKEYTLIGERGIKISGGQRQRIAIARALYHDPQIMFLDEATSSLDLVTEKKVMEAIYNLSSKITIIIIAHRLSTLEKCDIIYRIEKGQIVDSGSYQKIAKSFQTKK